MSEERIELAPIGWATSRPRRKASSPPAHPTGPTQLACTARVAEIDGDRLRVHRLEAFDGTPILDLKPALSADVSER